MCVCEGGVNFFLLLGYYWIMMHKAYLHIIVVTYQKNCFTALSKAKYSILK